MSLSRRQETNLIETASDWLTTEKRTDLNGIRLMRALLDAFVDAVNERTDHQVRADEAESARDLAQVRLFNAQTQLRELAPRGARPACDCRFSGPLWTEKTDGTFGWQVCDECPHVSTSALAVLMGETE